MRRCYARRPEVTVELRILGPFEVDDDSGQPVKLPAGRERTVLAVLALRRGQVVSTDVLIDAVWGGEPPSTAPKALQGYISHLRRLVDPTVLVTQPPGYALRVEDGVVDAWRFETLAGRGWRELDQSPAEALQTFEAALALWRGPPLGEFAYAEFAQREIDRLEELRLETVEGRYESMLRLGRHAAVVAELAACVDESPLRERLRGQLMLALYRSGRQAEALEVYREGRRRLLDELGLDPGTDLQRLERAILAQDPKLEAPTWDVGVLPGPRSRRRWMPVAVVVATLIAVAAAGMTLGYLTVRDDEPRAIVVSPPALVVIDPTTNRIVSSIRVGSRPVTVAAGEGAVWVGDARDGTVTQIDPDTKQIVRTIGVGAPVVDLAVGVGGVWAATGGFGEILRIDPDLGVATDRIPLGDPTDPVVPSVSAIGVGGGRVWAGTTTGLARIVPSSGATAMSVALGDLSLFQIAVGGGAVWATTSASRAERVEASSARKTTEFYAGTTVYSIALGGGAVWIVGSGQLWKVDPVTGAALLTSRPSANAAGVAFADDAVWVTSYKPDGELIRVDPASGEVVSRVPIGGGADDLVVHGGLVWIPVVRAA